MAEFDNVDDLLVVNVQSTSELSVPAVTTVSVLTATSVESSTETSTVNLVRVIQLDTINPDSGAAYYCQGGMWHLIDPRGSSRLYIQETQPNTTRSYMWVQTNYVNAGDFTIWLNDTTLDEVLP